MNEIQDFIAARKAKTGVEICEMCGGVIWDIDGEKVCGDCQRKGTECLKQIGQKLVTSKKVKTGATRTR
jgi:hypothetical protein